MAVNLGQAFSGINAGNIAQSVIKYTWYALILAVVFGGLWLLYYLWQYKYKVVYFERRNIGFSDPDKKDFSIGKIKRDRIKVIKNKSNQIEGFKLLWANVKINPMDLGEIMPNDYIFLFRTGLKNFIPVSFKCGNPQANFEIIQPEIMKWAVLELQQVAQDYQKHDFWTDNKHLFLTLGVVLSCCVFAGFVIWLAFFRTEQVVPALNGLTNAVSKMNVIPGIPPA